MRLLYLKAFESCSTLCTMYVWQCLCHAWTLSPAHCSCLCPLTVPVSALFDCSCLCPLCSFCMLVMTDRLCPSNMFVIGFCIGGHFTQNNHFISCHHSVNKNETNFLSHPSPHFLLLPSPHFLLHPSPHFLLHPSPHFLSHLATLPVALHLTLH